MNDVDKLRYPIGRFTRLTAPLSATGGYALDGQTVRATLAQGISTFLTSSRNASRVAQADVLQCER